MNRDFFIEEITPSIARKLVASLQSAKLYIDPTIVDRAKEGIDGDGSPVGKLVQFIIDYEHRCVIPYDHGVNEVREGIHKSLPQGAKVLFFDDPINWTKLVGRIKPFSPNNPDDFQFLSKSSILSLSHEQIRSLIGKRNHIVVMKMDYPQQSDVISRMFPKVIAYCEIEKQFSMFHRNDVNNSALACALSLFPHLLPSAKRLNNMPLHRSLPLIGGTNLFIKDQTKGKNK